MADPIAATPSLTRVAAPADRAATPTAVAVRRGTADRVFLGCLVYTVALSVLWITLLVTRPADGFLFANYRLDKEAVGRLTFGFLFFSIGWGVIWWGVKTLLLRRWVGFTEEERRQAFSSRMDAPYDVAALVGRYSERRIRITDMIGRRGRFITLQMAGFYYLYSRIAADPGPGFLTAFLSDSLVDAVVFSWVALALYYSSGFVARMFWGAQSRVMDGELARANCLLITTLWSLFKFVMVPIGIGITARFPTRTFAPLFLLIWGSYTAADAASEIVGSLFGKQKLRVWGVGDVNRKSVAGTWGAFAASLVLCVWVVQANGLPAAWLGLALVLSVSNTVLELFSPRGTDDFTMATANALLCLAFGSLLVH